MRVSAEAGDIVTHPFERHNKVEHARVSGVGVFLTELAEIEISEDVQTMIHADEDNIVFPRKGIRGQRKYA